MNKELKDFVEAIIEAIDHTNEATNGTADTSSWYNQLIGVQIALYTMGIQIRYDINPFFYKDKKASTYTLEIGM